MNKKFLLETEWIINGTKHKEKKDCSSIEQIKTLIIGIKHSEIEGYIKNPKAKVSVVLESDSVDLSSVFNLENFKNDGFVSELKDAVDSGTIESPEASKISLVVEAYSFDFSKIKIQAPKKKPLESNPFSFLREIVKNLP